MQRCRTPQTQAKTWLTNQPTPHHNIDETSVNNKGNESRKVGREGGDTRELSHGWEVSFKIIFVKSVRIGKDEARE